MTALKSFDCAQNDSVFVMLTKEESFVILSRALATSYCHVEQNVSGIETSYWSGKVCEAKP